MEIYINSKKRAYSFEFVEQNRHLFDKGENVKILARLKKNENLKIIGECKLSDIFNYD